MGAAWCLVYFTLAVPVYAADCKWIDTVGEAAVENTTPEEARQTALNRARIKAVESASGLHVQGNSLVKDFTLISEFIQAMSMGYVLEEKIVGWKSRTVQENPQSSPVTLYKVTMKSCVAAARPGDPYFKVRGELSRPIYVTGEEAVIKASCSKACYLTILNLTADNKMKVLMPNSVESTARLLPGESFTFPPKGLSLEMSPLHGHKKDTEAFYLVATTEAMNLSRLMKEDGEVSAKEFYSLLLSLPPEAKAEELLVYEVRGK